MKHPLFELFCDFSTFDGYNKSVLSKQLIYQIDTIISRFVVLKPFYNGNEYIDPDFTADQQLDYDLLGAIIGGGEI